MLARRVVSGSIVTVTDRETAQREAIKRLNPNASDLIRAIEADIKRQVGRMHVSVRGGDYTPEAVQEVASLYTSRGWRVDFQGGYWLTLE